MELLNAFGSTLALAALVGAVLTAAVLLVMAVLWRSFLKDQTQGGTQSRRPVRSLLVALGMCAGHGFLLLAFGRLTDHGAEDSHGLDGLGIFANATVGVPVGALALSLARLLSSLWPRFRWAVYALAVALIGLATLAGIAQILRFRQLDQLPAPIVELVGTSSMGCALLATGQVACLGSNSNGWRGHGYSPGAAHPTLVRGLRHATKLYAGSEVACALRQDGPPVCWGGCKHLRPHPECLSPWLLPGGENATALAVTGHEIAGMRADGSTFGWPKPLPEALSRVRKLRSDDVVFHPTICGIDMNDRPACFEATAGGALQPLPKFAELSDVIDVARVATSEGCAIHKDGRLTYLFNDSFRPSPIENAERILPLPDSHSRCCVTRRGAPIACWKGYQELRVIEELPVQSEGVFSFSPQLCARTASGFRCVNVPGAEFTEALDITRYDAVPASHTTRTKE